MKFMRRHSLKMQLLSTSILLVLLTIIGLSASSYMLIRREKARETSQRIQIAFDIMLNDFAKQAQTYRARVDDFLQHENAIAAAASLYNQKPAQLQDPRFVSSYIANAAEKLKGFAYLIAAQELRLYGGDKRLLAVYRHQAEAPATVGGYVVSAAHQDTYLPIDDASQLAVTLVFQKKPIPDAPLPDGVAPTYVGDIPAAAATRLFRKGTQLGFEILTPLTGSGKIVGILVSEVFLTSDMVTEYALLSHTAINFFVGDQLSIGTLAAEAQLDPAELTRMPVCQTLAAHDQPLRVRPVTIDGHAYAQGQCALMSEQEILGAVTVSLSRDAEKRELTRLLQVMFGLAIFTLGLACGLALWLSHRISRSVETLVAVVGAVAAGDLRTMSKEVRQDELGALALKFNLMIEQLRAIVNHVQHAGFQVTSAVTELSATAKEQEATLTVQVEATNNVLETVKEISAVAENLVITMQQVSSMLQNTAGFAMSGQTDLTRMQEAIQRMETASTGISDKMAAINEKAENITTVVTTITKVADQTNLLSLNAAIEAEKAGEYGRGFTVVAREIRRLADQTAVATLDIEQTVQDMQAAMTAGVMEMDKFMAEVRHSTEDVAKISSLMRRIIQHVQLLGPNFEHVDVAISLQAENAHAIKDAMLDLSAEMQETKATFHETYAAIQHLNNAAAGLQNAIACFKVA